MYLENLYREVIGSLRERQKERISLIYRTEDLDQILGKTF